MSCTCFVATLKRVEQRPDATDVTLKYVDAESVEIGVSVEQQKKRFDKVELP